MFVQRVGQSVVATSKKHMPHDWPPWHADSGGADGGDEGGGAGGAGGEGGTGGGAGGAWCAMRK